MSNSLPWRQKKHPYPNRHFPLSKKSAMNFQNWISFFTCLDFSRREETGKQCDRICFCFSWGRQSNGRFFFLLKDNRARAKGGGRRIEGSRKKVTDEIWKLVQSKMISVASLCLSVKLQFYYATLFQWRGKGCWQVFVWRDASSNTTDTQFNRVSKSENNVTASFTLVASFGGGMVWGSCEHHTWSLAGQL